MRIVRSNIFETNSSSTHTLTICTKDEYEKWIKGELLLNTDNDTMVPIPEYDVYDLRMKYFEYKVVKLENGITYNNVFYNTLDDLAKSEVQVEKTELDRYAKDYSLKTYNEYMNDAYGDMSYSKVDYISPSGDEIVGFGYGGYNG